MVIKYPSKGSVIPLTYDRTAKLVISGFSLAVRMTVSGFLFMPYLMNLDGYLHLFKAWLTLVFSSCWGGGRGMHVDYNEFGFSCVF